MVPKPGLIGILGLYSTKLSSLLSRSAHLTLSFNAVLEKPEQLMQQFSLKYWLAGPWRANLISFLLN